MSSNNLDKYEYLTGEYLRLKPSTLEQVKLEYSLLGKIFNKGLKEEDKKEGLLRRLKNQTNQESNNNDDDKSESSFYSTSSNTRSISSKKTSISYDELERSVYFPDVANMEDINISESKNETQTSFKYFKNNIGMFFNNYPNTFDSYLKEFFKDIVFKENENINYGNIKTSFSPSFLKKI